MGHLGEWVIWVIGSFKWMGLLKETFKWMGHSREWIIWVNGSFKWIGHSWMGHWSEWVICKWVISLWNLFKMNFQVKFDIFKKKLVDSSILSWMSHSSDNASLVELNSNYYIEDDVWAFWNLFKMKFLVNLIYLKKASW